MKTNSSSKNSNKEWVTKINQFFRVQTDREIFGCLNVWLVKVVEVQVSNEKKHQVCSYFFLGHQ